MADYPLVLSPEAYAEVRQAVSDCIIVELRANNAVLRAQMARDVIARKHGIDCPDGFQLEHETRAVMPNART